LKCQHGCGGKSDLRKFEESCGEDFEDSEDNSSLEDSILISDEEAN